MRQKIISVGAVVIAVLLGMTFLPIPTSQVRAQTSDLSTAGTPILAYYWQPGMSTWALMWTSWNQTLHPTVDPTEPLWMVVYVREPDGTYEWLWLNGTEG
jgi:hypothetical protein